VFKNTSNTLSAGASITPTDLTRAPLPLYTTYKKNVKEISKTEEIYLAQK